MREILLTKGKVALVDNEDYLRLSKYNWQAQKDRNTYYARRGEYNPKTQRMISKRMHREILNVPAGLEIDHINGNGLDNRKENLRICAHSENIANQKRHSNNKSGFRGVHFDNALGKWFSQVGVRNKRIYLGLFLTAREAAKAYDYAALKYIGKFARLNFSELEKEGKWTRNVTERK